MLAVSFATETGLQRRHLYCLEGKQDPGKKKGRNAESKQGTSQERPDSCPQDCQHRAASWILSSRQRANPLSWASSSCVGDWNVRMTSLPLVVAVVVFFLLFGIASSLSLPVPVSSGVPSHLARPGPDRRRPEEPIDSGLVWITTPSGWR